jgi:flagellar biosynthesis regulator FlbT
MGRPRGDARLSDLHVRMLEPLRAAIQTAAASNKVTMNAEAVERLQRSFRDDEIIARLDRIEYLVRTAIPQPPYGNAD